MGSNDETIFWFDQIKELPSRTKKINRKLNCEKNLLKNDILYIRIRFKGKNKIDRVTSKFARAFSLFAMNVRFNFRNFLYRRKAIFLESKRNRRYCS